MSTPGVLTEPLDPRGPASETPPAWSRLLPGGSTRLLFPLRLLERNIVAWKGMWLILVSVFFEPLLFLLSIGLGVGQLVGDVPGPGGTVVPYRSFVAGGLLATSAMMGPVFDSTFNFFVKLKYFKTYHAVLATPLRPMDLAIGELLWSLLRAAMYATAFLITMTALGLVSSWWALLTVPVSVLIGYAFAGAGMGATSFMRSFIDFDYINVAIIPMFLFSATFFPLSRYPTALQWLVQVTPLYQGVALERGLVFGELSWTMLLNAAYLAAMGTIGLRVKAAVGAGTVQDPGPVLGVRGDRVGLGHGPIIPAVRVVLHVR
jgi:lipooligosaccharide transport system permease protein